MLPQARVVLTHATPRARPDVVSLCLSNLDGTSVDEWAVEEPDYDPDTERLDQVDPTGDWELMRDFFAEVHRHATGYDRIIKSIEDAIATPGVIGAVAPVQHAPVGVTGGKVLVTVSATGTALKPAR